MEYRIWEVTKNIHKKTQQQSLNLIHSRYVKKQDEQDDN